MDRTTIDHEGRELGLHDSTIQSLFGMGLKLEYCIQLLDESPEEAKTRLQEVIDGLGTLIDEVRSRIYELH